MTTAHTRRTLFLTTLLAATATTLVAQESDDQDTDSPIRQAFLQRDISLEKVVRETNTRKMQDAEETMNTFSVEQAPPGRASKARLAMEGMGPGFDGLFKPMPLKRWKEHDQITIIVIESAVVSRTQELETEKESELAAEVAAWSDFFSNGSLFTQNTGMNLPKVEIAGAMDFDGEGDYGSKEQITFRSTATVLEVLPNGNLVLESRHTTKTDNEMTVKTVTGICDPRHVAPDDTILHWRLYDLDLNVQNSGFVKDAANKGILTQIADFIFAF
jgi:flagellar L-ring protein precursor FlgH